MASFPVIREGSAAQDSVWQTVGVCERIASAALLAVLSPVVAGAAVAVALASRRSPLIAHKRVGWRGETLWMLKLRTMWESKPAPAGGGSPRLVERIAQEAADDKQEDDPRVGNAFASFCRRHSIDELPQLWHVIRGEMSLVGPRPLTPNELRKHYGHDAGELLQVKPGLAGLWQVSGRNRLTYAQRKQLDLRYVRERSVGLYLRILVQTIPEALRGANSW